MVARVDGNLRKVVGEKELLSGLLSNGNGERLDGVYRCVGDIGFDHDEIKLGETVVIFYVAPKEVTPRHQTVCGLQDTNHRIGIIDDGDRIAEGVRNDGTVDSKKRIVECRIGTHRLTNPSIGIGQ